MTTKTQRQIAILKNKLAKATTRPDPTGEICEGLRREIARLQEVRKDDILAAIIEDLGGEIVMPLDHIQKVRHVTIEQDRANLVIRLGDEE